MSELQNLTNRLKQENLMLQKEKKQRNQIVNQKYKFVFNKKLSIFVLLMFVIYIIILSYLSPNYVIYVSKEDINLNKIGVIPLSIHSYNGYYDLYKPQNILQKRGKYYSKRTNS
eukprot:423584_1